MPKCPFDIALIIVVFIGAVLVAKQCGRAELVYSLPPEQTQGVVK
jgi:hypothetical protein